jgi:hypothetical protein
MTAEPRHRIWAFAPFAWLALIALPTTAAAIQWQRGIGRDPDMTGVVELIFFLVGVSMMPMAIAAFGVMAPMAIAVDRATRGRTGRLANVALGGALGGLGFAVFLTGTLLWGVGGLGASHPVDRRKPVTPDARSRPRNLGDRVRGGRSVRGTGNAGAAVRFSIGQ